MAHKKGVGSTDNGRDSISKRLGVKLFGGQYAIPGNIIVRQRGTKFHPGNNVGMGKDHTLYAKAEGFVTFTKKRKNRTFVSIEPQHIVTDEIIEAKNGGSEVAAKATPSKAKEEKSAAAAEKPKAEKAAPEDKAEAPKVEKAEKAENAEKTAEKQEAKTEAKAASGEKQDLKKVEGIGPKTEEIFNAAGIQNWAALAAKSAEELQEILSEAGKRYGRMDPTTWPKQAKMLHEGRLDELKAWQDELDGGRIVD